MIDIEPYNMIPGWPAALIAWTLHVAIPLIIGIVALVRSIRARHQAQAADAQGVVADRVVLAPGRACIHGPVEYAPGQTLALRIAIQQVGQNHKGKNGWNHTWKEISRQVTASPFYIRDDRGTRVRVEPDDRTLLVDKLDRTVRHSEASRERFAEIEEGETVYVVGELAPSRDPGAGGYRDAEALVMKPPSGGRLLVSSEPLGERFRRDAASKRSFAIFFFGFVLAFALADIPYHARVHAGRIEPGTVSAAIPQGNKSPYCELQVDLVSNKERIEVETSRDWCSPKKLPIGSEVPVFVVGSSSFVHVGKEPALHIAGLGIAAVLLTIAVFVYGFRSRAWYESKVSEGAVGKLPEFRS